MSRRRKRSKKWLYWLIFLILLIGAIVMVVLVRDSLFGEDKKENATTGTEEVASAAENDTRKNNTSEKEAEDEVVAQVVKDEVVSYDGDNPNIDNSLTGAVTYAGKVDDKFMIRVNIDQFLSGGSCELVLEKDGVLVHEEATQIVDSAATATCEGFDVTGAASGNYKITIKLISGEKQGVIKGEASI